LVQRNPISGWFRRRRFGFGWSPASWEGWAATAFAAVLIGLMAGLLN
jgi:hypothetical protein